VALDQPDARDIDAQPGSVTGQAASAAHEPSGVPGQDGEAHWTDGPQADDGADGPGEPRKPRSAAGWILLPFAVVWRFLFPKKPRPFLVELPFLVIFALFLAFLIKTFLVQAFYIPSGSMQNTLAIGDRVLVNRAAVWLGSQPQRGEIVVFQDPGGWLSDEPSTDTNIVSKGLSFVGILPADNGDLIKRVIGVGGDRVVCCNAQGDITVNGVALSESSYLFPGDSPDSNGSPFDITVPQGRLWVMGDHRSVSLDSRAHQDLNGGTIPVSAVVGRADVIVWPVSQWATLPIPNTFKQAGFSAASALGAPGATPAVALGGAFPVMMLRRKLRTRKPRRKASA
jgi:signal peptidase I